MAGTKQIIRQYKKDSSSWQEQNRLWTAIVDMTEFKSGNMEGTRVRDTQPYNAWELGRLDREKYPYIRAEYVIYSYATPIAWFHVLDGWTVPDEKYSITTARHQGIVRTALSFHNESYKEG